MAAEQKLSVLIAEDNDSDRMILSRIVTKQGYRVIKVADGEQAIATFQSARPDIVLLDVLMPKVDGYETARQIKKLSGVTYVPVIFLTSLQDADYLAACVSAGGDDFLSKPYKPVLIQAKLMAAVRMRNMNHRLQAQNQQITAHKDHLIQEQRIAKEVFDKVTDADSQGFANVRSILSPLAVFNGDILLQARKPSGGLYVLLGDFTGHGLPAAIGAMPAAEIFHSMASKGFAMPDILRAINDKLKNILPVGFFCCATLLDFNFLSGTLDIWNGGLPPGAIYRHQSKVIEQIQSRHLPLGVLSAEQFKMHIETLHLEVGDRVYLWSDGILEAQNNQGENFGEERIYGLFDQQQKGSAVTAIKTKVNEFLADSERQDDITLVEVAMVEPQALDTDADLCSVSNTAMPTGPLDWDFSLELRSQALQQFNPLPLLLHNLMEIPNLQPHSGKLYTLLAELFSNALEHGVLGLDSGLKATPSGFADYYQLRKRKLADLTEGWVKFHFTHQLTDEGGELLIQVQDSGPGFDFKTALQAGQNAIKTNQKSGYCGRGLTLIKSLCHSLTHQGNGNQVECVFTWQTAS